MFPPPTILVLLVLNCGIVASFKFFIGKRICSFFPTNRVTFLYSSIYIKTLEDKRQREKASRNRVEEYRKLTKQERNTLIVNIKCHSIIDRMLEKNYVPTIYNGCFGGLGMSYEAEYLLNLMLGKEMNEEEKIIDESIVEDNSFYGLMNCELPRGMGHDIDIARLILFLGDGANGGYSRPVFDFVKQKFAKYISTDEDDGFERISIDYLLHKEEKVKELLDVDHLSSEIILENIREVVHLQPDYNDMVMFKYAEEFLSSFTNSTIT
jgi:hypothetical protein